MFLLGSMAAAGSAADAQVAVAPGSATFNVFVRGRSMGTERVDVTVGTDGVTIAGSSRLAPPIDLTVRTARITYDAAWQARNLAVEGTLRGQAFFVRTEFTDGRASNVVLNDGRTESKDDTVTQGALALPNNFFGAYEALAARLSVATPGNDFQVYLAPQAEVRMSLTSVQPERIQVPDGVLNLRRNLVTFHHPGGSVSGEIWSDERGRLARASLPGSGLDVVREDIASVTARRLTHWREGDLDLRIPATGFSISATISRPAEEAGAGKLPAAVLVAGEGLADRDENVAGLPVFGQLAGLLADRGFVTVRYDKRGVGQSGGRAESATIADYAEDVRAVVKALGSRPDVDEKRIIVVGYGQGAAVAMLAARREKRISGLALLNGFGTTGAELVLEQQQAALARSALPEAEQQARIELQKSIHAAVLSGEGWDGIPPNLRMSADTAWFRSFLAFDPSRELAKARQPVLILHGDLDKQILPRHADRLAAIANGRKRGRSTDVVHLAGVNHILIEAVTGEVAEYSTLTNKLVAPEVGQAIRDWTDKLFPGKPAGGGQSAAR